MWVRTKGSQTQDCKLERENDVCGCTPAMEDDWWWPTPNRRNANMRDGVPEIVDLGARRSARMREIALRALRGMRECENEKMRK